MKNKALPMLLLCAVLGFQCSQDDESDPESGNPVYLDKNGITVKSYSWARYGDKGEINGIEYTVANLAIVREMIRSGNLNFCTSRITNMSSLFAGDTLPNTFNGDISSWDVSNVTNMGAMFSNSVFNQDISSWDVSNVTNMEGMFSNSVFNQDISSWDVGNVRSMNYMFSNSAFNQDISSWDVSHVTEMYAMFSNSAFDRNIGSWDVGNVRSMAEMFSSSAFNRNISSWDVANVVSMEAMFYGALNFNQNLSAWDVQNVQYCLGFSWGAPAYKLPKPNFMNDCNCGGFGCEDDWD